MAHIERKISCISTCAWDDNIDHPREICLNDVVWHDELNEFGFITRHKKKFYFENYNRLIPLTDFQGYTPNFKCELKGLMVETDYYEIERFIRHIFTEKEIG